MNKSGSKSSGDFELEPLLEGNLVQSFNSLTIFTCKLRDLKKITDDNDFRILLQSLNAVKKGLAKRNINEEAPTVLLLSNRQPAIRGQKIGIYHPASLVSASSNLGDLNPTDLVWVVLSSDVVEPETLFRLKNPPIVRFNTDLPKLKLRSVPTEFLILSEPFVINEDWGYNAVFEVEVPSGDRFYISPNRSLRDIFEHSRRTKDLRLPPTVVGNLFRVWKKSDEVSAGFDGLEIQQFSNLTVKSDSVKSAAKVRAPLATYKASSHTTSTTRKPSPIRKMLSGQCKLCRNNIQSYHLVCLEEGRAVDCPVFVR